MSLVSNARATLPQMASTDPAERARGYWAVSSLFVNGNSRDLQIADIVLPSVFSAAACDPLALVPLATAAHGLFGVHAYGEALLCFEPLLAAGGTGPALSRKDPPWDARVVPFTRERELALQRLFRYECLLALGGVREADDALPEALSAAHVLPAPFKLSRSIMEWGDAHDFVLRARIRAVRALRLRASGGDVAWLRKVPKKHKPKPEEARRLLRLAHEIAEAFLPELDAWLPHYQPFTPGAPPNLGVDEKRALQEFRADGYAEAGLLARDDGDLSRAARLLATAHHIYSITRYGLGIGVEPEYAHAIRALAPIPALLSSS